MYLLFLAAKCIGVLFLVLALYVVKRHMDAVKRVKYYASQGMSALPGFDTFFIGNAGQLRKYIEAGKSKGSKFPQNV